MEKKIKELLVISVKEKNEVAKNILRLILGEFQQRDKISDLEKENIVRKIIKSNNETISLIKELPEGIQNKSNLNDLFSENIIMEKLLPQKLTKDSIICQIDNLIPDIKNTKNDGQAIGIIIKHFKNIGITVDSVIVKEIVLEIKNVS